MISTKGTGLHTRRAIKVGAVLSGVSLGVAAASQASAAIVYDSNTNLNGTFSSEAHYAQQITLAATGSQSITDFTVFGVRWNDVTQGQQDLFLDFYTGADLSPTATDALASAINIGEIGFSLGAPAANGSYNYTLTLGTPVVVPTTFTVEVTMTNAAANAFSTAIGGRFSAGTLATGSDTGFVWDDTNLDGVFSGSEQNTTIGGATPSHIRMAFNATPVPEPITAGVALVMGGVGLCRRRPRASRNA